MSTQADADELVFIVDETHEDKKCDSHTTDCPNQAVVRLIWTGGCCAEQPLCLPHHDRFFSRAAEGLPTDSAYCTRHGDLLYLVAVKPIPR